jgi:hypothetical protein
MADQPTSQGTKVGKTNVKMQGQTAGRHGSEYLAQAPAVDKKPVDVNP